MRARLVAGNWKMNGRLATNESLLKALVPALSDLRGVNCLICAPYPYLGQLRESLQGSAVRWGAQDVCEFDDGAYTGGVSAGMVADFGCSFVIVGHSERRALFGESCEQVARKFVAAQKAGLTPILCVGETLAERESGVTERVIAGQLDAVIQLAGVKALSKAVVAYEPVWAIGTGKTASPAQAQSVHQFIRGRVAALDGAVAAGLVIQYGGSVKSGNAGELFAMPDIDGGLIGGASLVAAEFAAICRAAAAAPRG